MLTVEFRTDDFPKENSIVLTGSGGRKLWNHRKFKANRSYRWSRCNTNNSCTVLDVTDTYGDGLDDDGYIKVTYGSAILYDGSDIGYGFYIDLGDLCYNAST